MYIDSFSCGFDGPEPEIPPCEWDDTEMITDYDLTLGFPGGLSSLHLSLIPFDRIERSFLNILETDGNAEPASTSRLNGTMTPDGSQCTGSRSFNYEKGNPNVFINQVNVPFPSNADFVGDVALQLRTDLFVNTVGPGACYYIKWDGASINPEWGLDVDQMGVKIITNESEDDGEQILRPLDDCYIRGGLRVCP